MKSSSLQSFLLVILALILFGLSASCEVWKYNECRKVGHSTTWCVLHIGGGN